MKALACLRRPLLGLLAAAALLMTGCLENRLVWSPDGSRAAFISGNRLYLCSPEGALTGPLLDEVHMLAWTRDPRELIAGLKLKSGVAAPATDKEAWIWRLQRVRLEEGKAKPGAVLWEGKPGVDLGSLRVSPDGRLLLIAYDVEKHTQDGIHLAILRLDGSQPALELAKRSNGWPDWTPDSASVVYLQSRGSVEERSMGIGTLRRQPILSGEGALSCAGDPEELAYTLFGSMTRVRCLADGRILFNATQGSYPIAANEGGDEHEQLFCLDRAHGPSLMRLIAPRQLASMPDTLSFFEPSPDASRAVISGGDSQNFLLQFNSGQVEAMSPPRTDPEKKDNVCTAQWRNNEEFSFVRWNGEKSRFEVVLKSAASERVLSQDWPEELVRGLAK